MRREAFIIDYPRRRVLPRGVSVTLVEPRGPVNVGHVARLVRNFGVEKLYLVDPKVDLSVAAVYASHAAEVLDANRTLGRHAVLAHCRLTTPSMDCLVHHQEESGCRCIIK